MKQSNYRRCLSQVTRKRFWGFFRAPEGSWWTRPCPSRRCCSRQTFGRNPEKWNVLVNNHFYMLSTKGCNLFALIYVTDGSDFELRIGGIALSYFLYSHSSGNWPALFPRSKRMVELDKSLNLLYVLYLKDK